MIHRYISYKQTEATINFLGEFVLKNTCTYKIITVEQGDVTLYVYTTEKNNIYREFIQYYKVLNLPTVQLGCIFLALKDENDNIVEKTLWNDKEVCKHLRYHKKRICSL